MGEDYYNRHGHYSGCGFYIGGGLVRIQNNDIGYIRNVGYIAIATIVLVFMLGMIL